MSSSQQAKPSSKSAAPKKPLIELTKGEQLIMWLLAAVQFVNVMDFVIMMPLGPQLMKDYSISPQQFSFLVASYNLAAFASGLLSSTFVDRFDRKQVLLMLLVGFTVGTTACALAPTYEAMLGARLFTGLFGGVLGATALSIVGDALPAERRGYAMGVVMGSFAVASALGIPLALYLAAQTTWHWPFYAIAGMGAMLLVAVGAYMPKITGHLVRGAKTIPVWKRIQSVAQNPNQRTALLAMFMVILGHLAVVPFINPYLQKNLGYEPINSSYVYLVGGIASVISSPIAGRLADKYGKQRVFTVMCLLAFAPVMAVTILPVGFPVWATLGVAALFFVFGGGRMIPANALTSSTVTPQERGGFMSISSATNQLAGGIGSLLAGAVIGETIEGNLTNYWMVGLFAIATSIVSIFLIARVKALPQQTGHLMPEAIAEAKRDLAEEEALDAQTAVA